MKHLNISNQNLPYYRMAGYIVTILMHTINVSVMLNSFRGDAFQDPNIQVFYYFMDKFITCWTFVAQSVHAVLGLSCDILTIMNEGKNEPSLLQIMKYVRNALFACIVVPYTFMIATAFWPIFLYNRELVLPTFTTKIVSNLSNHVMHSAIVPATLWEMAFQPRDQPSSHRQNTLITVVYTAIYLAVIFTAFSKKGMFPYPLMTMLYGSVYFVLLIGLCVTGVHIFYFGQWRVNELLWRRNVQIQNVKKDC